MRLHRLALIGVALLCTHLQSVYGLPFPQGCGGGGEVAVPDPCVKCRCVRGSLVCRLRVCSPQPHPPPPGCLVLTRRAECCQRLVCSHAQEPAAAEINRRRLSDDFLGDQNSQNGCTVNGTMYAEGSAMDSSTRCEYCYCIRGEQRCVRPQCQLARTDCTPSYTAGSCCPAKYNCNEKAGPTTTTSKPSGCTVAGKLYPDGQLVPGRTADCESCYCLQGKVQCEPVICTVPINKQCVPVFTTGHCCPTSYNCSIGVPLDEPTPVSDNAQEDLLALNTLSIDINQVYENSERSITGTKSSYDKTMITDTTQSISTLETTQNYEDSTILDTTTLKEEATTTVDDNSPKAKEASDTITDLPTTTEGDLTTLLTTNSDLIFTDTEERIISRSQEELTTIKSDEDITTLLPVDSVMLINITKESIRTNTTSAPNKSLSSEIEIILNSTKLVNKNVDYDYDYNEPSLPPSLPNLRIIPFVAADAVVDDHQEPVFGQSLEKSHSSDDNHFYDLSHPHGFSPPAETEGGFVPKESILDGPFYESKHDSEYFTNGHKNGLPIDITSGTSLSDISGPSKTTADESKNCVRGGHNYRHGELLSAPLSCELCMCFYGKVLCQKPKCPIPEPGCQLLHNQLNHSTCCHKIVCNGNNVESPTRVVEHLTPAPHLPPFTVADVIVTPDPFRDVIRTEPAPDLSSLIGEILPFLWDQSTSSTTPVSLTTAEPNEVLPTDLIIEESSPVVEPIPIHSETQTATPSNVSMFPAYSTTTTTSIPLTTLLSKMVSHNHSTSTLKPPVDYDKEIKEGDKVDDDDEFSLDSVFSYLFDTDKWTTTTEKPPKIKNPAYLIKMNSSQFMDGKYVNKTLDLKANISKVSLDQILEHRSDEDINELSISNSTIINQTTNPETTTRTDNNNTTSLLVTLQTSTIKSTPFTAVKLNNSTVPHTTIKNLVSKLSTKHYGIKYPSTHSRPIIAKPTNTPQMSADPGAASGLLKLAGCNIYGRMYRVGRIISELSGPCLECMCTEVGVQCRPLKC